MTPLGKPLVFYLKYLPEMARLYGDLEEDEESDLTGLNEAEQVREKVRAVGDAACEKVADFLELCGKGIEDHFTAIGATIRNKKKRAYTVNNWTWSAKIYVSSASADWFWCGVFVSAPPEVRVSMENDACGVVVPVLWSKGGHKGADAIWNILGGWPHSRSGEGLVDSSGSVALACIPIKSQSPGNFDVDRDLLIAEVMKTITRIGAEETRAIASLAAGLKEPDED